MSKKVRHLMGISGGKDSAALAIYLNNKYPGLDIEYYFCDTGKELKETLELVDKIEIYLGKEIKRLRAIENLHFEPFDYFLKTLNGYLPSPQSRWCTKKLKLEPFENFVGSDLAISYVGIRGDEDREGYISTKPNIQSIFPFRKNIWSLEVLSHFFQDKNIEVISELYRKNATDDILDQALSYVNTPKSVKFSFSKKLNSLLDLSTPIFNKVVFDYHQFLDSPVSHLSNFPLIDNEDNLNRDDIFKILEKSGVGVPAYYNKMEFTVDGRKGEYSRSRSGCFFCFFQQRIEWVWLHEQHPDLFKKAMEYEKDGYTWIENERLEELIEPERLKQIKLTALKNGSKNKNSRYLIDKIEEAESNVCANCFI